MRKILAIVAVGMCVAAARAEEPPHLDFARRLRESHYPDLAMEYLEKLTKTAPADMQPSIELEIARSRLDIARTDPDSGKRPALFAQARAAFEAIVKNNPSSAQASEAKLAITDIAVLQGKTLLQKAQLQKATRQQGSTRQAEALKARAALGDAAKQLEIGIKELETKLTRYDEAKTDQELKDKKALQETKLRAELERGIVLVEEAETF